MQSSWEPDFFVGEWRVRPALVQLERGELGVPIEARSLQVLSCLARHAPNVVSKDRLIREVWGEAFVTDEVLSHAVWELRKAFGDEARNPSYIQTIAKKGYRLLVAVSFGISPEPLAAGCRITHYEIVEPLGGGAMGQVYKARDLRLGRIVALKFLPADLVRDPSARRRFLREAQAVARLDHPNVATLYEAGESEGGWVFLAIAFYDGETVQQKLSRGPLPLCEAVPIARQMAKGLAAAHREQIVHRDVKPANVMVLPDGTVKLLDFGLAKMAGATTLTRLGASPGTPAYKSPEQTRGEKVDPRSDLWALGVVLYEMVTGSLPFGAEYEQAVIYAILNEPPRPLDGVGAFPPELVAVIEQALAKDAAARHATAEDLEEELAIIPQDEGGKSAPRRRVRTRPRPRLPLTRHWLAGVAALVVLSCAVGIWQWRKHRWDFSPRVAQLVEKGDRLEWRGDLFGAEQAYRRALALDSTNPLIEAQLAALLVRIDNRFPSFARRQESQRLTASAVDRAPDRPMPWVARATFLLLEEDRPEAAEQAARKAVDADYDFDRGHVALGEAIIAQGRSRLEEGLTEIGRGVEVGQGYPHARLVLAEKLRDDPNLYEIAFFYYRIVLAYDPDNWVAKESLAALYLERRGPADALPLAREVFDVKHDARSAENLAQIYLRLNRMNEAIDAFSKANRLGPSPFLAMTLGSCYLRIGKRGEAHHWYEVALLGLDRQISNSNGGPRAQLFAARSSCAVKLGRFDEALANVQEAVKLQPKDGSYLYQAAQVCARLGRRIEVYGYARRAVQESAGWRDSFRTDATFRAYQNDLKFRSILESAVQ